MQEFLSEVLMMVLQETSEKEIPILPRVLENPKQRPGFEKGAPKRANKIGPHRSVLKKNKAKQTCPDM